MKVSLRMFGMLILVALGLFAIPAVGADQYHFLKEIPIGGEGGWDYLALDSAGHRLYVSHGTKVVVIDVEKEQVAGEIDDTPGVHGFAIAPELGRGFSSNGRENKVSMVDLRTLKTLSKVQTGENPDAILYEPSHRQVYTFNGRGHSSTVLQAESGKVVATIPLEGKPEFATVDRKTGRIYCNLEDKNQVVSIDTGEHKVVDRWPIAPGEEASGMAIDSEHHRLFLGCANKLMVMMSGENGKVIGSVPIGEGVDANCFDAKTHLAFASCREGTVTIAHEDSPEKLTVVQTLKTEPGARTMALDPKTHKIYLSTAKLEGVSEQSGGGRQRPKIVPGTFKVLVYGIEGD